MLNRQKQAALTKLKGVPLLLKYLAAFCVLHNVGATSLATSVTPPSSCSCTAELEAMAAEAARVAEQTAFVFGINTLFRIDTLVERAQQGDLGASDGSVVIDQLWKRKLQKLLAETPIAASLIEAVRTLPGVDQDDLAAIIEGQRDAWGNTLHTPNGRFRLPADYPLDYAIAIHVYTLEEPRVYGVVNRAQQDIHERTCCSVHSLESLTFRACSSTIVSMSAKLTGRSSSKT